MKINVKTFGIKEVRSAFLKRGNSALDKADKVTETYTRKMANESAEMAPVDTGKLKNSIAASPERVAKGQWQYGSDVEYARRQEYEHRTRKGFIRKSVWNNRDKYRETLRRELTKD